MRVAEVRACTAETPRGFRQLSTMELPAWLPEICSAVFSTTVSLLYWGIYMPLLAAWESVCGVAFLLVGKWELGVCADQTAWKSAVRGGEQGGGCGAFQWQ